MSLYLEPQIPPVSPINVLGGSALPGTEPYYVVGVDPLHTTISQSTFQTGVIVVAVLAGLTIITLIFVGIGIARNSAKGNHIIPIATGKGAILRKTPVFTTVSTPGQSSDGTYQAPTNCQAFWNQLSCQTSLTRVWNPHHLNTGTCDCISPFWGFEGEHEMYSDNYYGVGNPSSGAIAYQPLQVVAADRLSFPFNGNRGGATNQQVLCTELCDQNPQCNGVLWEPSDDPDHGVNVPGSSRCTLLSNNVLVNPGHNIPFNPYGDATLYLKNSKVPLFNDRVFLYRGNLPTRYWVLHRTPNLLQVQKGIPYALDFIPTDSINSGGLTGIYSPEPIAIGEGPGLLGSSLTSNKPIALHRPDTPLLIPGSWVPRGGNPLWVVYI